jgi:hypothetical protein
MTIAYKVTTFDSKTLKQDFGYRIHDVHIDVSWVSSGYYEFSYPEFEGMSISVDPEWIDKIIEIYPTVEKNTDRKKAFVPFFQVFDIDRGMFDAGHDEQFSAYKSRCDGWIVMHSHLAINGVPTNHVDEWIITIDDLKALNDKLKDPSTEQPIWSGCQIEWKNP